MVPKEFYIVMSGNPEACIGTDDSNGGHSYWKNGEWVLNVYDTMVRAEIECIYEPVGGELVKGSGSLFLMALMIMVLLIGVTGIYGFKRRDLM